MRTSMHDDMCAYVIELKSDLKKIKWYKFKQRYNLKKKINSGYDLIFRGILK